MAQAQAVRLQQVRAARRRRPVQAAQLLRVRVVLQVVRRVRPLLVQAEPSLQLVAAGSAVAEAAAMQVEAAAARGAVARLAQLAATRPMRIAR